MTSVRQRQVARQHVLLQRAVLALQPRDLVLQRRRARPAPRCRPSRPPVWRIARPGRCACRAAACRPARWRSCSGRSRCPASSAPVRATPRHARAATSHDDQCCASSLAPVLHRESGRVLRRRRGNAGPGRGLPQCERKACEISLRHSRARGDYHVKSIGLTQNHQFLTRWGAVSMVRAALRAVKARNFLDFAGVDDVRRHARARRKEHNAIRRSRPLREAQASRRTARSGHRATFRTCGASPPDRPPRRQWRAVSGSRPSWLRG